MRGGFGVFFVASDHHGVATRLPRQALMYAAALTQVPERDPKRAFEGIGVGFGQRLRRELVAHLTLKVP